jgi:hypothetical protein
MNLNSEIFRSINFKRILIVSGVSFFALHTLFFISFFGINVPIADDWDWIPFAEKAVNGENLTDFEFIWEHGDHRPLFPNLVYLFSIYFTSWNFLSLMYFGWILVTISVLIVFQILKNTFPKLIWLIIPISAIMYSPAQYENFLWAFTSVEWFLVSSSLFLSIYFLNKMEYSRYAIAPAIFFGIVSTFSGASGLAIWFVGTYSILFQSNRRKISLLIWFVSGISIFIVYFIGGNTSRLTDLYNPEIFSIHGVNYFLFYLANGFVMKIDFLRSFAGAGILVSILLPIIYYAVKKRSPHNFTPWIQFGLISIFSAGFTVFGRFSMTGFIPSRLITQSVFAQIAALVIVTIVFYYIYSKTITHKKLVLTIYVIVFSIIIIAFSSSYYLGYLEGSEWSEHQSVLLECLENSIFEFKCNDHKNPNWHNSIYQDAHVLQDLKLGPFIDNPQTFTMVPLLYDENWKNMQKTLKAMGVIDDIRIKTYESIDYESNKYTLSDDNILLQIYGWAIFEDQNIPVESVYVIIDDHVHNKADYGFLRKDLTSFGLDDRLFYGWFGLIDMSELSLGCHDLSIRIVHDNQYAEINTKDKLCKTIDYGE